MADPKPLEFIVKSSINVKSMGDPRKLAANLESEGMRSVLGTIVGIAQAVNRRADPKGGPDYVGLVGAFAAIPSDTSKPEVRSTICYLPDAVHGPIAASLEKAKEGNPTANVRFAMEAGIQKGGTAGFTWEFRPLFDGASGSMVDPLSEIRRAIVSGAKMLPAATEAEHKAIAATTAVQAMGTRFDKKTETTEQRGSGRK